MALKVKVFASHGRNHPQIKCKGSLSLLQSMCNTMFVNMLIPAQHPLKGVLLKRYPMSCTVAEAVGTFSVSVCRVRYRQQQTMEAFGLCEMLQNTLSFLQNTAEEKEVILLKTMEALSLLCGMWLSIYEVTINETTTQGKTNLETGKINVSAWPWGWEVIEVLEHWTNSVSQDSRPQGTITPGTAYPWGIYLTKYMRKWFLFHLCKRPKKRKH